MAEKYPLSEAAKRVYQWRLGGEFAGTEEELWDWFNNWSGRNADGSLTYKTMLYEKLEEVANELAASLRAAQEHLKKLAPITNKVMNTEPYGELLCWEGGMKATLGVSEGVKALGVSGEAGMKDERTM